MMELAGKRVVVTRSRGGKGRLSDLLAERGAEVITLPTIAIEPPQSWGPVDDAIRMLAQGSFEWVAFTSVNAVEKFCSRLGCMPGEVFRSTKVAAVGSATGEALAERSIKVELVPQDFTAEALAAALGEGEGSILLPRAEEVPPVMVDVLRGAGWKPHEVAAYRTVPAPAQGEAFDRVATGDFDIVTFTSASTVRGFAGLSLNLDRLGLIEGAGGDRTVACIGPVTAAECSARSIRVDVVAGEHTARGLVDALAMAT